MVWGYFDESGEHVDGRMTRLSIAGCISSAESWKQFDIDWANALAEEGINYVHMVDLASPRSGFKSPYYGWEPERKSAFLDKLVSVMSRHILSYAAVRQSRADENSNSTSELYNPAVTRTITTACVDARNLLNDRIQLVFAKHPEMPYSRLAGYCDQIAIALPGLAGISVQDPKVVSPLQAADIFSWEFSHCKNWSDVDSLRSTLRTLRNGASTVHVWPLQ